MPTTTIFIVGIFVASLCAVFFGVTVAEMKKLGAEARQRAKQTHQD